MKILGFFWTKNVSEFITYEMTTLAFACHAIHPSHSFMKRDFFLFFFFVILKKEEKFFINFFFVVPRRQKKRKIDVRVS